MGSLKMFGARTILLIFIALGTNGQLLTEKIPLGRWFFFIHFYFYYRNWIKQETKTKYIYNTHSPCHLFH